MTLSEIETILEELALRHQNLNTELLTTLLLSAGWEDKNIKEAITLFKKGVTVKPQNVVVPEKQQEVSPLGQFPDKEKAQEEITFYQPDGTEEKELRGFATESSAPREAPPEKQPGIISTITAAIPEVTIVTTKEDQPNKELTQEKHAEETKKEEKSVSQDVLHSDVENKIEAREDLKSESKVSSDTKPETIIPEEKKINSPVISQNTTSILKTIEPQSLVVPEEDASRRVGGKKTEIPEDLPLLPFESSPHVWSFSRYKNVFHGEGVTKREAEMPKPDFVEPKKEVFPSIAKPQVTPFVAVKKDDDQEVELKKTPITKGDESLVVLAGVMLLVIILILGYMYSNGRL